MGIVHVANFSMLNTKLTGLYSITPLCQVARVVITHKAYDSINPICELNLSSSIGYLCLAKLGINIH